MSSSTALPRRLLAAACGLSLAMLAGCNGSTPPEGPGQSAALPAMQPGPTSVGAAGLGPAGQNSAIGSGNLADPMVAGPAPGLH
ncbi:hypothetical protein [Lichenicoccus roseus]|uniref:Uncharacterized protein n=1 Tax=Lichenicoccus roseus TaxID=2683649 RepID=A0A5R9J0C8_9PROT|nr:hypothetical protein [Lichenicoccus roseus]TLU70992.1 hypothetical protein FE263_19260 [Lichenicoccus roseus]